MEKQKKNYHFLNLFLILEVKEEKKKKINEETFCVLHRFQRLCIIILMILATKKNI